MDGRICEVLGWCSGKPAGGGRKRFHSRGPVHTEVAKDSEKSCMDVILNPSFVFQLHTEHCLYVLGML